VKCEGLAAGGVAAALALTALTPAPASATLGGRAVEAVLPAASPAALEAQERTGAGSNPTPGALTSAPQGVRRVESGFRWNELRGASDWAEIDPLPAVQSAPVYAAPPSERTEFRLAHDDENLYAAAWMYDSEADGIRAVSLRRDEPSFTNDWFLVSLDTYRDMENTLLFATSPAGVRTDAAFGGDGSPPPNMAWNAFWDAEVTRDDEGWYAAVRIPLSSLRFEERDGHVVMGVTLARRIARRNEMISWPAVPHDWGVFSIYKASMMREIVLEGVAPTTPVYVTPYALGGASRVSRLDPGGPGFVRSDEPRRESGFDLKVSPTSNLTVDLTVNPEFAQVEADEQQVNLTRFSLFFPERRPFFQERASVFEYSLGGNERLFHSRRIGLAGADPVRIYGGARVMARSEGWDVGLLSMQTASGEGSSGENAGVLRVRRRVLNEQSAAGVLVTSRLGSDGRRRFTGAADGLIRVGAQDYLTLNAAETREGDVDAGLSDRSFVRARLQRRGIYGPTWDVEGARAGSAFNPALGFVARNGYTRGRANLSHGWQSPEASPFLGHFPSVGAQAIRRIGGELESARVAPSWRVETKAGHLVTFGLAWRLENLEVGFPLGEGVRVPEGRHRFTEIELRYGAAQTARLRFPASAVAGSFYDGRRVSASVAPGWNPSSHLQLSGSYRWDRIRFPARSEGLDSHLVGLRALAMLDTRISATVFVQYGTQEDRLAWNLRLRYNPREGEDLYLVYDHSFNTARTGLEPLPPRTDRQAFVAKYSRTFTIGF
jgi:hypothetical protein